MSVLWTNTALPLEWPDSLKVEAGLIWLTFTVVVHCVHYGILIFGHNSTGIVSQFAMYLDLTVMQNPFTSQKTAIHFYASLIWIAESANKKSKFTFLFDKNWFTSLTLDLENEWLCPCSNCQGPVACICYMKAIVNSMKLVISLHWISWVNSFSDISRK